MKVTFTLSDLSRVVPQVAKLPTSKFMTQLSMLRFVCEKDKAFITGSDGNIWLTRQVPCEADKVCEFLVDPKEATLLIDTKDSAITLNVDPKKGNLHCKYSKGDMSCRVLDAADYPDSATMRESNEVTMPSESLRKIINDTRVAVQSEEKLAIICGICLEASDSKLSAISTNTHRLHVSATEWVGEKLRFVIPPKIADLITSSTYEGDIVLRWSESQSLVQLNMGETETITGALLAGNFPNWQRTIPAESTHSITFDSEDAIAALKRVMAFSPDAYRTHWTVKDGMLVIYGKSAKEAEVTDSVTCSSGIEIRWAANGQYMLDAIQRADSGAIKIEFISHTRPISIRSVQESGFQAIVMPMALDSVEDGK